MTESADVRAQLAELVSQVAASGERELPSLRDLASRHGVSPNTVKKILLEIREPMRVVPVHGRGFFLVAPGEEIPGLAGAEDHEGHEEFLDAGFHDPGSSMAEGVFSVLPGEERPLIAEPGKGRDCVIVVGQLVRATDPTGAPGARFQLFLQTRQSLQSMGYRLSWAPLEYDRDGRVDPTEIKALELQIAALGDRLAGVLLIDPGYGRETPLWQLVADATEAPVVWFHSAPLDPALVPDLPPHCHVLEPDWHEAGVALGRYMAENYHPQKIVLLPPPGERAMPAHLAGLRETLLDAWGARWVTSLGWFDVFPESRPQEPRSISSRLRRVLLDTGLAGYELDRFFVSARRLRASLWVCADDLLALAAIDHFESLHLPNEPRPGVLGFGNHPFSLARGLCTVDLSWPSFTERAIELFTGYGRRNKVARYVVVPAPSDSMYGGNILARSEDWW